MLSLAEASCFLLTGGKKDKFMRGLSLLWSVMGWRGSSLWEPIHKVPTSSVAHWAHPVSLWWVLCLKMESLADSSHSSNRNCWSWSKIALIIFCFLGICADIFSPNTSVCVPFWGREARETCIKMHSCSLLLLPTSVSVTAQKKGFEGPYDLCEVPLLLPGSPWGIARLLIIWVGGPNPLLCGTSGLLVKKGSVSFISLTSPAMFSYLFPSHFANASVRADTWWDRLGSWSSWKLTHFSEGVGKDLFGDCLLAQRRNRNEGKGKVLPLLQQPVLMLD